MVVVLSIEKGEGESGLEAGKQIQCAALGPQHDETMMHLFHNKEGA